MLQAQLRIEHLVAGARCLFSPGAVFDIEPLPFLIGRGSDCHLIVSHHEVSRRQAQIGADGDYCVIVDLDSQNGTYVNNQRLTAGAMRRLLHDDLIQLANAVVLRFLDLDQTQRSTSVAPIGRPGLWLNLDEQAAFLRSARIPLTTLQYRLLALLYHSGGAPVTRQEIATVLWETDAALTDAMIDNTVSRLRSVLLKLDPGHDYIVTLRGHGYRFVQRD